MNLVYHFGHKLMWALPSETHADCEKVGKHLIY